MEYPATRVSFTQQRNKFPGNVCSIGRSRERQKEECPKTTISKVVESNNCFQSQFVLDPNFEFLKYHSEFTSISRKYTNLEPELFQLERFLLKLCKVYMNEFCEKFRNVVGRIAWCLNFRSNSKSFDLLLVEHHNSI